MEELSAKNISDNIFLEIDNSIKAIHIV